MLARTLAVFAALSTCVATATAQPEFIFRFADSAGNISDSFTINRVGETVDVRVYLEERAGGVMMQTQGVRATGVAVLYDSDIATIVARADVIPAPGWGFPIVEVRPTDYSDLNVIVPSSQTPVAPVNNRVFIGTFRFTARGVGMILLVTDDACPGFCANTLLGNGLNIDNQIADRSAILSVLNPALCPADFDNSGGLGAADIFAFLNAWFASSPAADFDGLGGVDTADIFAFLNAWFAGC